MDDNVANYVLENDRAVDNAHYIDNSGSNAAFSAAFIENATRDIAYLQSILNLISTRCVKNAYRSSNVITAGNISTAIALPRSVMPPYCEFGNQSLPFNSTHDFDTIIFYDPKCEYVAAAWMFIHLAGIRRRALGDILFYAVTNTSTEPNFRYINVFEKRVIFVGVCYTEPKIMTCIATRSSSMIVLGSSDSINKVFAHGYASAYLMGNSDTSTVMTTWKYLFGNYTAPWWINYITDDEDHDVLPHHIERQHRIFTKFMSLHNPNFELFDKITKMTPADTCELFRPAITIYNVDRGNLTNNFNQSRKATFFNNTVYVIPVCKHMHSIARELNKIPDCDFVIIIDRTESRPVRNTLCLIGDEQKISSRGINLMVYALMYGGKGCNYHCVFTYLGDKHKLISYVL